MRSSIFHRTVRERSPEEKKRHMEQLRRAMLAEVSANKADWGAALYSNIPGRSSRERNEDPIGGDLAVILERGADAGEFVREGLHKLEV